MLAFRKTGESHTASALALPQRYFVSPEVFALEKDRIFSTHWLCVGHQSQLPNRRDYFVQEVACESLIWCDMTNRQDWHVCELSQQDISSRAYQPGPYSPRESIPAAWDREYLRAMEDLTT